MCRDTNEEQQRGHALAQALVTHMEAMGGAALAVIPLSHVDRSGRLQEWEVTVKLLSVLDPAAPEPTKT